MLVQRIRAYTRIIGAPDNWDEKTHGPCAGLPVRDQLFADQTVFMLSAHEPTPDELKKLLAGQPIILGISAVVHPVMFLHVGDDFI